MNETRKSERPCQLYRHWSHDGQLLYVGVSLSAAARLSQHRDKPWFDQIAEVTVQTHPSREEAVRAEAEAIRDERPVYNIVGNPRPRRRVVQTVKPQELRAAWAEAVEHLRPNTCDVAFGFMTEHDFAAKQAIYEKARRRALSGRIA